MKAQQCMQETGLLCLFFACERNSLFHCWLLHKFNIFHTIFKNIKCMYMLNISVLCNVLCILGQIWSFNVFLCVIRPYGPIVLDWVGEKVKQAGPDRVVRVAARGRVCTGHDVTTRAKVRWSFIRVWCDHQLHQTDQNVSVPSVIHM